MKKQKHFTVCRWTPRVWTKGGGEFENKYFHNAFFAGDSELYVCYIFRYILYRIFPRDQNPLRVRMPIARHPHGVIYTSGENSLVVGTVYFLWHLLFLTVDISFLKNNEYAYRPHRIDRKMRIIVVFKKKSLVSSLHALLPPPRVSVLNEVKDEIIKIQNISRLSSYNIKTKKEICITISQTSCSTNPE